MLDAPMKTMRRHPVVSVVAALLIAVGVTRPVAAADIAGVRFDDVAKVGGTDLTLNGVGVATKSSIKTYTAGLYLSSTKRTTADVLAVGGPVRLRLVPLRDLRGDALGSEIVDALNRNSDKATRTAVIGQIGGLAKAFASQSTVKKGDSLTIDWVPGVGATLALNGRPIADGLSDKAFFNALLRAWLGDRPLDSALKSGLLGTKSS